MIVIVEVICLLESESEVRIAPLHQDFETFEVMHLKNPIVANFEVIERLNKIIFIYFPNCII